MGAILRAYTAAEQWADRGVHWLAVGGAVTGLIALLVVAGLSGDASPLVWTTLGVYGAGLVVMFGCSMLSNHDLSDSSPWAGLFQRLDHAGILFMIAATYTPLTLHIIGGVAGWTLLLFIWAMALFGMGLRLFRRRGLEPRKAFLFYLALGWSAVFVLQPLVSSASLTVAVLVITGGLLYSLGVPFFLWWRLPFHRTIWHAFVVAAASCHYAAVMVGVALTGGMTASS